MALDSKLNKLVEKLDDYRPDQQAEVIALQKTLKLATLKKNFKEHPAMKMLMDLLRKREVGYTLVLANKEDLSDIKRQGYFDRRAELRWILSFFDVDQMIENIEKRIDAELEYQLSNEVNSGDNT